MLTDLLGCSLEGFFLCFTSSGDSVERDCNQHYPPVILRLIMMPEMALVIKQSLLNPLLFNTPGNKLTKL